MAEMNSLSKRLPVRDVKPIRSFARWTTCLLVLSMSAIGETGSKSYPVQEFDRVTIRIPATVAIRHADRSSVQVSAEPKVLDSLRVTARDRVLTIDSPRGFSTTQPLQFAVSTVVINGVALESPADVTIRRPRG